MSSRVTKVEVQKNNKKRVSVFMDNEYAFACDMELIYKHDIKIGSEFDSDDIYRIVENDNYLKAKRDALYIIEKSYKTEKELKDKLLKKGYGEEVILPVLDFLKEYNFIDDTRYVKAYFNDKSVSQGKNKIMYDLKKKGVNDELIQINMENVSENEEMDVALKLAQKKYKVLATREGDGRKIYEKLSRYLFTRGYSWEVIKKVLNALLKDMNLEE